MNSILDPIEWENFSAQYWESELLHISRTDPNHFSDLLSVSEIENYLLGQSVLFPQVQVVDSRHAIPVADYTSSANNTKTIIPQQLMHYHQQGATVVVSHAHEKFEPLRRLCRMVNKTFQMRCQANVYLSPPGNQGFHSHYDTHDVFILQVSGSKTFRFFSSEIDLPFPDDTYHPDNNSGAEVLAEAKLSAGDTLYIPRGLVHDALADESQPSLHITLGVFPFVMRDLLQEIVQVASERNVNLRRSVEPAASLANQLDVAVLLNGLLTDEIFSIARSRLADEVATESIPNDIANSVALSANLNIDMQSTMTVVASEILNFERQSQQLVLRLVGQVMRFTEPMATAVEALLKQGSMRVQSLPGLDDEQRFALCTHLLQASVVAVSSAKEGNS